MRERPDLPDLLLTVRDFLAALTPTLPPVSIYDAQVAVYLLDIARREIELPSPVGEDDVFSLCADIRAGRKDDDWDATLVALLASSVDRVRRTRPGYLAAEHKP
jgi:hypothetical protein